LIGLDPGRGRCRGGRRGKDLSLGPVFLITIDDVFLGSWARPGFFIARLAGGHLRLLLLLASGRLVLFPLLASSGLGFLPLLASGRLRLFLLLAFSRLGFLTVAPSCRLGLFALAAGRGLGLLALLPVGLGGLLLRDLDVSRPGGLDDGGDGALNHRGVV
jgi:hypothetical protein